MIHVEATLAATVKGEEQKIQKVGHKLAQRIGVEKGED